MTLFTRKQLDDHCRFFDFSVCNDTTLTLVLCLQSCMVKQLAMDYLPPTLFLRNKPTTFAALSLFLPSVYIVVKSEEVHMLEVSELKITDLLSFYQSSIVICIFNGF